MCRQSALRLLTILSPLLEIVSLMVLWLNKHKENNMPGLIIIMVMTLGFGAMQYDQCKADGLDAEACAEKLWDNRTTANHDNYNK